MKNMYRVFASLVFAIVFLISAGCTYIAPGDSGVELTAVKSIGVLPAQAISLLPSEAETMEELQAGVETINSLLAAYFTDYQGVTMVSRTDLEGLSSEPGRYLAMAREVGQQLQYDAVLVSSLERYRERKGSEYAVISPASVAFTIKLLAIESGQVICTMDFDQTQQPLFENILPSTRSTGSGFRWLTAAELASAGLNKKLATCPNLKRD